MRDRPSLELGKRFFAGFLIFAALLSLFAACARGEKKKRKEEIPTPVVKIDLRTELNLDQLIKTASEGVKKVEAAPVSPEEEKAGSEQAPVAPAAEENRHKTDKEYLALRRYEQPLFPEKKSRPVAGKNGGKENVLSFEGEKPLVFAGRGFEIRGFESGSKDNLSFFSAGYLEGPPLPEDSGRSPDRLDLREGNVRSNRSLIFSGKETGFFKAETLKESEEGATPKAPPEKKSTVEKIPETKPFLSQDRKSDLLLLPKKKSVDALMGNENVNRDFFENR